jgi:class 3 adenylate cyclase
MPFPFLQRGNLADSARQLSLTSYVPSIILENLVPGIDNVRHDVFLSPRFTDTARTHILKLIAKHGNVEDLIGSDPYSSGRAAPRPNGRTVGAPAPPKNGDPGEFKRQLADLHIASLNRGKAENNFSLDLLFRLAVLKFQRAEMTNQFNQALERCRARVKQYEGPRQAVPGTAIELRDRFAKFQINKKNVLRRVGQDLFLTIREVEKESLSRTRRSLFGEVAPGSYDLFLNRLIFTEDGRDDFLNAEHYVMLGNYDRDPDRFQTMQEIAGRFLKSLGVLGDDDEQEIVAVLSAPENAQEIMAGGVPDDATPRGKSQKVLLNAWVDLLERESVMDNVVASYEVVPLLGQYSPPINPQQLKNALISRPERKRVEALLEEQGKTVLENLHAAVRKVENCKGGDRAKTAGRFFSDFTRYHRDLRRMEALLSAMDSINVITSDKFRELSAINNTLYEFLLAEEQRPSEDKVIHHVILKADIRDSSTLTRTLVERGLNPASYFSLNFYDPINKLLPKYEATKVFIEGDAVILALFEREGEAGVGVGRTCVLAREMIEIVKAYNERSRAAGLPVLELGIGISYQDSAPLYLMDGSHQIMISKALNESDRLSSSSKGMRKQFENMNLLFNVFSFKTVEDDDTGGNPDEFLLRYNIGGIHINEAAFQKLRSEISLQPYDVTMPLIWDKRKVRLYSGVVPIGGGLFHKIVIREGAIPHIDARDFTLKQYTQRHYYEICTNAAIYKALEAAQSATAGK